MNELIKTEDWMLEKTIDVLIKEVSDRIKRRKESNDFYCIPTEKQILSRAIFNKITIIHHARYKVNKFAFDLNQICNSIKKCERDYELYIPLKSELILYADMANKKCCMSRLCTEFFEELMSIVNDDISDIIELMQHFLLLCVSSIKDNDLLSHEQGCQLIRAVKEVMSFHRFYDYKSFKDLYNGIVSKHMFFINQYNLFNVKRNLIYANNHDDAYSNAFKTIINWLLQ